MFDMIHPGHITGLMSAENASKEKYCYTYNMNNLYTKSFIALKLIKSLI